MDNIIGSYTFFGIAGILSYGFFFLKGIGFILKKKSVPPLFLLFSSIPSLFFTCAASWHLSSVADYSDKSDIFNPVGLAIWVNQLNVMNVVALLSLWILFGICAFVSSQNTKR